MASGVVIEGGTSIPAKAKRRKRGSAPKTGAVNSKEPAQSRFLKISIASLLCPQDSATAADPVDSASPPSNLNLEYLASAVGCREVLEHFCTMVEILNTSTWSIDMGIESAARLLNFGRANAFLASLQEGRHLLTLYCPKIP